MTNATDTPPETLHYLTVDEIAADLRLGRMTVYRLIQRGTLTAIRPGGRAFRIPADSYAEYKRQLHTDADQRAAAATAVAGPGQIEIPA